MKIRLVDRIEQGDAMSRLRTDSRDADRYSEWHHFNFNDDANQLYGIFNLALSGDVRRPDLSRAGVSLVVSLCGNWRGTMNIHGVETARFSAGAIDLDVGPNHVRFQDGRYHVAGGLKDGSVTLDATYTPRSAGVRIQSIGGMVSSFVLPRMQVDGALTIDGRTYVLRGATGYHDHNWGYWSWGRDLGWDWGYILQTNGPLRTPGGRGRTPPFSIVFGQVTDSTRAAARSDLVLMVWAGQRCAHVFLDDAVEMATAGELDGDVPRVPGLMTWVEPNRRPVPRSLRIEARDGEDWLEISLEVAGAMQFLIPHPNGSATTTVSELVGRYDVRGELEGEPVAFAYTGFAELAG